MKVKTSLALLAAGCLTSASLANPPEVLYDNGPLSTGPLTNSGVAAPAGTNWSEVQADAGNTTQSNTTAGFSDSDVTGAGTPVGGFRLADDFTVPAGETWDVSSICVFSYKTGAPATPSPFDAVRIQIWDNVPRSTGATVIFGDLTTNRMVGNVDAGLFRIFNTTVPPPGTLPGTTRRIWQLDASTLSGVTTGTPLVLASGTYWVEWQVSDTVNGAHFGPSVTIVGARGLPGWNARQFTAAGWVNAIDTGNPATAPDVPQDQPFIVKGKVQATEGCAADCAPPPFGDNLVNINDLLQVIGDWGPCPVPPTPCPGDVDPPGGNGVVDINDLLAVIGGWGPCPDKCDTPFNCNSPPAVLCEGTTTCFCTQGFFGNAVCAMDFPCANVVQCPNGNCPPGFVCIVNTCCVNGAPVCAPVCTSLPLAPPLFGDTLLSRSISVPHE